MGDRKDGKKQGERKSARLKEADEQNGDGQNGEDTSTTMIMQKLNEMTGMIQQVITRLDVLETRLKTQEKEHIELKKKVNGMEKSLEFVSAAVDGIKKDHGSFLKAEEATKLKQQVEDLSNRSRRNNIVVWGIPEGSESSANCVEFLESFFDKHMELEDADSVEIERAHRSPMGKLAFSQAVARKNPRPIHVKLLRYGDRERILRLAPKVLKNNDFKGNKVFISDDVTESVRMERKQLLKIRNKLRDDGKIAVVPWNVPACLLVKSEEDVKFKKYTVSSASELIKK